MRPDPRHDVTDTEALRALFPPVHDIAVAKQMDRLDAHALAFVARSPFLCIATQSADGTADVSPRGDPPGFVRALDDRTLLIPDRPGNNRLDTLTNILANPSVGLIFMVPGYDETLRVNGRARITRDPGTLAALAVEGRAPRVAIVVEVAEAFLHCAKAFRRSRLWAPEARQDRRAMPSLVAMILDQTGAEPRSPEDEAQYERDLEEEYRRTMY
jgi:PPOX class probable FMN-dependent enzyme